MQALLHMNLSAVMAGERVGRTAPYVTPKSIELDHYHAIFQGSISLPPCPECVQ